MRSIRDEDSGNTRTVTIEDVRGIRKSEKALLCDIPGEGEMWIPQTQIHDDSEVYQEGDVGKLVITKWIAEQKGLV